MNIRLTLASTLAILMLLSCAKEENGLDPNKNPDVEVAFLSLRVDKQPGTRNSDEDDGLNESDIKSLYIITFDNIGNIVGVPGGTDYYTGITTDVTATPDAIKVSAKGTKLLIVANPGSKLLSAISSINATSTFALFNQAILDANMGDITDNVSAITKGFAMISSGDDTGLAAGQVMADPLIDITGNIKKLEDYPNEAAAKAAAEGDRAKIHIERLSSKIELKVKATIPASPAGAKFTFGNWTLDAVNSTFYPFAEKTMLDVPHSGSFYLKNFYTKDPNFTGKAGIRYTTIESDYTPKLVPPYIWMDEDDITYCIENTMAAAEQKFENATRLVIKGTYHPVSTWSGDWFNFAGTNYENLVGLQAAYALGGTNLTAACDDMFNKIKAYATAESLPLTGTNFATLVTGDLVQIPNGGELIKTDKNTPCIRWYQGGLSYYYYEVRHDDETTVSMAFGKYGVVRNNWYSLTLAKVNGAGTPWYPDIENPGPGDPDGPDPIDDSIGMLAVEVEVMPWIIGEREIEI